MTKYTGHLLDIYQHTLNSYMTSNSDNGSASTFSYLTTILYHVHIVRLNNYGIEQLSTFKHIAGSITITHKLNKILNLSFIHIYFQYHKCLP